MQASARVATFSLAADPAALLVPLASGLVRLEEANEGGWGVPGWMPSMLLLACLHWRGLQTG